MALYATSSVPSNIDPTPSTSGTISTVNVGTTAVSLLAANTSRKGLTVYNNSNRIVYLGTSASVTSTSNFFSTIPANSLYEWSLESIYTGAIFAIANGTNANCQVLELIP